MNAYVKVVMLSRIAGIGLLVYQAPHLAAWLLYLIHNNTADRGPNYTVWQIAESAFPEVITVAIGVYLMFRATAVANFVTAGSDEPTQGKETGSTH